MDELQLNDERRVLQRNSKAWRKQEWERYRSALWEFNGLVPAWLAAIQLGVSRQRVHAMFEQGVLERLEFFGHPFAKGEEIDALVAMEKERSDPAFRWSKMA